MDRWDIKFSSLELPLSSSTSLFRSLYEGLERTDGQTGLGIGCESIGEEGLTREKKTKKKWKDNFHGIR